MGNIVSDTFVKIFTSFVKVIVKLLLLSMVVVVCITPWFLFNMAIEFPLLMTRNIYTETSDMSTATNKVCNPKNLYDVGQYTTCSGKDTGTACTGATGCFETMNVAELYKKEVYMSRVSLGEWMRPLGMVIPIIIFFFSSLLGSPLAVNRVKYTCLFGGLVGAFAFSLAIYLNDESSVSSFNTLRTLQLVFAGLVLPICLDMGRRLSVYPRTDGNIRNQQFTATGAVYNDGMMVAMAVGTKVFALIVSEILAREMYNSDEAKLEDYKEVFLYIAIGYACVAVLVTIAYVVAICWKGSIVNARKVFFPNALYDKEAPADLTEDPFERLVAVLPVIFAVALTLNYSFPESIADDLLRERFMGEAITSKLNMPLIIVICMIGGYLTDRLNAFAKGPSSFSPSYTSRYWLMAGCSVVSMIAGNNFIKSSIAEDAEEDAAFDMTFVSNWNLAICYGAILVQTTLTYLTIGEGISKRFRLAVSSFAIFLTECARFIQHENLEMKNEYVERYISPPIVVGVVFAPSLAIYATGVYVVWLRRRRNRRTPVSFEEIEMELQ